MTQNRIRVAHATDPDRYLATDHTVWFDEVPAAPAERQLLGLPEEQRFAADMDGSDPGTYPGIYGVFPLTLSVPGPDAGVRQVPCAGLTWVGVHPDHRRQGVLTAMLRHHFEQVHEEAGTHVSALHASEPAIYGRHGYGLASLELEVSLGRGTTLTAPHLEDAAAAVTTHLATVSDADVPKRHARVPPRRMPTSARWSVTPATTPGSATSCPSTCATRSPGGCSSRAATATTSGSRCSAAASKWERARPAGELEVWAVVGDPGARLALLRRLVDFDLIATVKVRTVGVDDPLLPGSAARGPPPTSATYDSLWVRLVDLPEALQDRAWSAPCDVVVEVVDTAAPWNDGTWRIHADDDGPRPRWRGRRATADVRLPVEALGAAYLGGGNLVACSVPGSWRRGGAGAAAELWRAMRTEVAPTAALDVLTTSRAGRGRRDPVGQAAVPTGVHRWEAAPARKGAAHHVREHVPGHGGALGRLQAELVLVPVDEAA